MTKGTRRRALCMVLVLGCASVEVQAKAAAQAQAVHHFLLSAGMLPASTDAVRMRFEYRAGEQVLGADDLLVPVEDAGEVLVPIPDSPSYALFGHSRLQAARVYVWANERLVAIFDRQQLAAHVAAVARRRGTGEVHNIICDSPCGGGCSPSQDYDCDGVSNSADNCHDDYNPDQADCDNDGFGNECDVIDGVFQPSGAVKTCMTDKDDHGFGYYFSFEHHVEQRMVDVSSCGSPSFWNRWIRLESSCLDITDLACCTTLKPSISAVGDSHDFWCHEVNRNKDFCH